ncbi:MAG: hypothetical protein DMG32_15035 [Acidobacteria bacterium]|nr:MAG: hypothetical protein DMG32_15035 [Acidobacteriota bacterium]
MKRIVLWALLASLVVGCKYHGGPAPAETQGPEASIRTAIQAHLAHQGSLNLQAFDTDVKQVNIEGDHAQAQVEFRVKGGPGAMQLTYSLEKREGAWSVIESDPVGSNFSHPSLNPGQTSETNGVSGPSRSLADTLRSFQIGPPPAQNLPPGHPPVSTNGVVAPPGR